jgi:hypothetical protein
LVIEEEEEEEELGMALQGVSDERGVVNDAEK